MEHLPQVSLTKLFGLIIFGSIVIFQFGYILLQWYYIRRREYLFYAAYMVGSFLYGLEEFEHYMPFRIFSRLDPNFHWHVFHGLPVLLILIYYHFLSTFVELPTAKPKLYNWILRLKWLLLIYCGFELISNYAGFPRSVGEYIFRTVSVIIFFSSLIFIAIVLKNSNILIRFAVSGAALLLIGAFSSMILLIMETNGTKLPVDPFLPMLIGVIAELLTFTTGLSYKSRLDSKEVIKVQGELIGKLKENEMLLTNMYNIRNKIARDLHDDLGSTLTSISLYSEIGKQSVNGFGNKQTAEILSTIGERSRDMINNMADIIWAINPQNDSMQAMIQRMQTFAANVLPASGNEFTFTADEHLKDLKIPEDHRKNIFLIYKEAVHNAVKYAHASVVDIKLQGVDHRLILSVNDNGKGFDTALVRAYNGNGLQNMKTRANEIGAELTLESKTGEGTAINLNYKFT